MPLYANGTLIPENVANALTVNGVNITQVIANGVAVWTQSLCKVCSGWSGNSTCVLTANGYPSTFESSGTLFRVNLKGNVGAWNSVNSEGVFSGTSYAIDGALNWKLVSSGNTILPYTNNNPYGSISFVYGSGLSGNSNDGGIGCSLETSAGQMRHTRPGLSSTPGAWISLT